MNKQTQDLHIGTFTAMMKETLTSKGGDYAKVDVDVLSNFKHVAEICNTKPELVALQMIATKVARLGVLLTSDKAPNNESIRDSVKDLACYSALLDMILSEREGINEGITEGVNEFDVVSTAFKTIMK